MFLLRMQRARGPAGKRRDPVRINAKLRGYRAHIEVDVEVAGSNGPAIKWTETRRE